MTRVKCNHDGTKKFGYSGRKRVQRWRCLQCRATFVAPTLKPLGTQLTGLHIRTILALMVTAGEKCQRLLDGKIRNVRPHLVQADELHSFVGCHEKRLRFDAPKEWGSIWTWLALDNESKLIISHYIGQRDADSA